jgi:cysteine-rich repeat protein
MRTPHQTTDAPRIPAAAIALVVAVFLTLSAPADAAAPAVAGLTTRAFTGLTDPLVIPDNSSVVSLINVTDFAGTVVDVDVAVDISHTSTNQLDIFLISPSGTTVTLTTDNGGFNENVFSPVTFDDQAPVVPSMDPVEAAENVVNANYVDLQSVGVVQPEGALGALVGESAEGPWALVVTDDNGGQQGTLNPWTLTISTVPLVQQSAPSTFSGGDTTIPTNFPQGVELPLLVSGVGTLLYDLDVTVDIAHETASNIDLYLTSPAGTTIDLVTDVGGGNDNLYAGTTFDDSAEGPVDDITLPDDGIAFTAVVPEGALAAFIGEDPNGIWLLTVADDSFGNSGDLNSWSLRIVTGEATCGNGVLDGIEVCDDGNGTDGDGCDSNCTPTGCGNGVRSAPEECDDGNTADGDGCPATCAFTELDCSDCTDNNSDGLVDALDPDCAASTFTIGSGNVGFKGPRNKPRDSVTLKGSIVVPSASNGRASLTVADGNGPVTCVPLGPVKANKSNSKMSAKGKGVSVKLSSKGGGVVTVKGKGLDLSKLDDSTVQIGLQLGPAAFSATTTFSAQSAKRWSTP